RIPLNGEFIMAPGAAFAAFDGRHDPGCETGSEVTFTSTENYQWYNPTLWHAATSLENLERGRYIFSVDEERVPCQYDDVLFQPESSFRVNVGSAEQMIQLRSISVMGQKFTSDDALSEYMQRPSAKLQFQGQAAFRLSSTGCPDKTGCECGNTAAEEPGSCQKSCDGVVPANAVRLPMESLVAVHVSRTTTESVLPCFSVLRTNVQCPPARTHCGPLAIAVKYVVSEGQLL
ncbi:hypothetical protein lerEdw1_013057, partial [Lerista edwardsae]